VNFDEDKVHAAVRESVREFAERRVAPGLRERDEAESFPLDLAKEMGELGFMGLPFPEEYGGAGLDYLAAAIAVEEISRIDASLGITLAAHISLGCGPIHLFGSDAQKKRYLTPLAQGEMIGAFGLTEPGSGSDAGAARTTATKTSDGWVVNGSKAFITNATVAGVTTIAAATAPGRLSNFIVPAGTPGFRPGKPYQKMGLHTSDTAPISIEDCRLPADALLGEEGRGFRQFLHVLDGGRITIGAMSVGIARGCYEAALAYSKERQQFGKPIGSFQAVQFKLADMATEIELARFGVYRAAWLKDQGRPYAKEAGMGKLFASELCVRAASEAVQIFGGWGFMRDSPVERFYRDAKLMEIGEGTSEVQRLVIAREIGCPSS
jgi:alkylation response protein AidB-like acyl-CoA dehydrogenase